MTNYERAVLSEIDKPGSQPSLAWGAAMGAALGYLQGSGYVTRGLTPEITDKGREALKSAIQ